MGFSSLLRRSFKDEQSPAEILMAHPFENFTYFLLTNGTLPAALLQLSNAKI